MPQIIQNKSHRRNRAHPVHNIIYRVYISTAERSVAFTTAHARKHIQQHTQYRRMQSVPSRRWRRQHAISYVLARGSMDRAQGIRLIAQAFSLYLSSRFPPFSFSCFLRLSPTEEFLRRKRFSIRTKISPCLVFAIRTSTSVRRITTDAIRNYAESSWHSLWIRAAVTNQSELETKRVVVPRPNISRRHISRDISSLHTYSNRINLILILKYNQTFALLWDTLQVVLEYDSIYSCFC